MKKIKSNGQGHKDAAHCGNKKPVDNFAIALDLVVQSFHGLVKSFRFGHLGFLLVVMKIEVIGGQQSHVPAQEQQGHDSNDTEGIDL